MAAGMVQSATDVVVQDFVKATSRTHEQLDLRRPGHRGLEQWRHRPGGPPRPALAEGPLGGRNQRVGDRTARYRLGREHDDREKEHTTRHSARYQGPSAEGSGLSGGDPR